MRQRPAPSSLWLLALASAVGLGHAACGNSAASGSDGGGDASGSSDASGGSASSGGGSAGSSGSSISSGSSSGSSASGGGSSGSSGGSSGSSGSAAADGGLSDGGSGANDGGGDSALQGEGGAAKFDHLVVILMENHNLSEIYGTAMYMTQLADQNVLLQKYTAIDHPSEPNYLAIASGQTFNPPSGDDAYHVFTANNIVDSIESAGKTWRAYSESATQPCDTGNPDVRHVPFLFFADVVNNAARCARVIPTTPTTDAEMIAELNSSSASNFIWLTPNDANNMHTGTIAQGDAYLMALVPKILGSTTFTTTRAALFIVFDEGNNPSPNDLVYALWAGPVVKKALKVGTSYSHYSVLATLGANWGFPALTSKVSAASAMMEVFQ
jgi:hypothetical protein